MKDTGRVIATITVWGGVALLSYLFNSFGILSGVGAGCMFFGAFIITLGLWKIV